MKKILYVIENIYFGGGERAFAQIISGLDKGDYDIYVACGKSDKFIEKVGPYAKILPFVFRGRLVCKAVKDLSAIIRERDIDIVHSQGARADFIARIATRKVKKASSVSTVAMLVEGFDVCFLKKVFYIILERFSRRFVDKFIVVSESLRRKLVKDQGVPGEKVVVITNGVEIDPAFSSQQSAFREKIRKEFNIPEDMVLVGAIGRLVWQKGFAYLIQAAKEVVTNLPTGRPGHQVTRFMIVGEGSLRKHLEELVSALGLSDKFIFTGFRSDIKEILSALDVFVLSSVHEGQPIVLLEAMAAEKPIIATDIEGAGETIEDGLSGVIVASRQASGLAQAIGDLAEDRQKAQVLASQAKRKVEARFDIKAKVEQYQGLYQSLGV